MIHQSVFLDNQISILRRENFASLTNKIILFKYKKDFEKRSKVTQKEKYLKNLILYKVAKQ